MPYFTSGGYVDFNDCEGELKSHHKVFILNQELKITITSLLKLLEEKLLLLSKLFVKTYLKHRLLIIYKLLLNY